MQNQGWQMNQQPAKELAVTKMKSNNFYLHLLKANSSLSYKHIQMCKCPKTYLYLYNLFHKPTSIRYKVFQHNNVASHSESLINYAYQDCWQNSISYFIKYKNIIYFVRWRLLFALLRASILVQAYMVYKEGPGECNEGKG